MTSHQQHHSGVGDNVAGDKVLVQIRSLAPADLIPPIDMVFESLRKKDRLAAKMQMSILKAVAQRDVQTVALVEAIAIYGELVEEQDLQVAWQLIAGIVTRNDDPTIKDVCLAAMLKLSSGTDRETVARDFYMNNQPPGPYAFEEYLRRYSTSEELEAAGLGFPSEGVLTGAVEGAIRLENTELALRMASRLKIMYASYNSAVLSASAVALGLNPELSRCHFWLTKPEIKEQLDDLAARVANLLEQSEGGDKRVQDLACSIFNIYLGAAPADLSESLKKYRHCLDSERSELIAHAKEFLSEDAELSEERKNIRAAFSDSKKRTAWCRQFLAAGFQEIEKVKAFIQLATPSELEEWQSRDQILETSSPFEEAYIRLVARVWRLGVQDISALQRHELSQYADDFFTKWNDEIGTLNPAGVVDVSERLFMHGLPDRALRFTSCHISTGALWLSPLIIIHLKCLLEADQFETFEVVVERVKIQDKSLIILDLKCIKEERLGNIEDALLLSDYMVDLAPFMAYAWRRGCYLRARYRSIVEQQKFHAKMPNSVFENPTRDAILILQFLAKAGDFKRVEPLWVKWFIQAPRDRAVDLVNFHFGISPKYKFDVSSSLQGCITAFEYEQEGEVQIRLIVDDDQGAGDCTLKSSSQLSQLLERLQKDEVGNVGMVSYKLKDRLPPYVGCLRIALRLRNIHNDGSDCFAMMNFPSEPSKLVPYLEEKMANEWRDRKSVETADAIPLYMRGNVLYPNDAFKAALNCWSDSNIPKSPLWNLGESLPCPVVLDAYSIGYLASTDLVDRVLESGTSFVLTPITKESLEHFIAEISDENFLQVGLTDSGRLFRTTASDLRERAAHILRALCLIREKSSVVNLAPRDVQLQIYSIKEGIDNTVYSAMQLSMTNGIPWFCMDSAFAALHCKGGYLTVNAEAMLSRAMACPKFDFERMRHSFLLFSAGALPLAFSRRELFLLAATPNALASLILYLMVKNHGRQIFNGDHGAELLLAVMLMHLLHRTARGSDFHVLLPSYTPWQDFTDHVFNHSLRLYLSLGEDGAEMRLATAVRFISDKLGSRELFDSIFMKRIAYFVQGHFLDLKLINKYLQDT